MTVNGLHCELHPAVGRCVIFIKFKSCEFRKCVYGTDFVDIEYTFTVNVIANVGKLELVVPCSSVFS